MVKPAYAAEGFYKYFNFVCFRGSTKNPGGPNSDVIVGILIPVRKLLGEEAFALVEMAILVHTLETVSVDSSRCGSQNGFFEG
jgi:hypothetical protein